MTYAVCEVYPRVLVIDSVTATIIAGITTLKSTRTAHQHITQCIAEPFSVTYTVLQVQH